MILIKNFSIIFIFVGSFIFIFSFLFSMNKYKDFDDYEITKENFEDEEINDDSDFLELLQGGKSLVRTIGIILIVIGVILFTINI